MPADWNDPSPIDWEQVARRYDPAAEWEDVLLIRLTAELIARHCADARRVIEVGTATGVMTELLLSSFDRIEILEPARANIEQVLSRVANTERITAHQSTIEEFAAAEPYDLVIFSFVLEHVEDPLLAIRSLARLVRPGGRVVLTVPNYEALNRRVGLELGMVDRLDYFQEKDRKVGHRRLYSLTRLREELGAAGTSLVEVACHGLFLKPLSKAQVEIWGPEVIDAFCKVGLSYPDLCVAIFMLLEARP